MDNDNLNIYKNWINIAKKIVDEKLTDWKQLPNVTYMLEHEFLHAAKYYMLELRKKLNYELIQKLADLNDSFGNPIRQDIEGIYSSTSSIRYIKHAYDILELIKNTNVNIIEVGGGYGGLALITLELARYLDISIDKYIIYDIPEIQNLQKYYLSNFNTNVIWNNSQSFGEDLITNNNFLVSNYCLSEIKKEYREQYLKNIVPKTIGVYMHWNSKERDFVPDNWISSKEIPDTGNGNSIIIL